MKTPNPLQKGDQVAIVATARKTTEAELKPAIDLLKKWGLAPVIGASIGLEDHQFAGSDEARAEDFQQQLNNPKIKAIWCACGGYGTVQILDKIDFSAFKKHPKWIVGYSDVTALHSHIHQFGIATLHAQMGLDVENKSAATRETLRKALFGEKVSYEFPVSTINGIKPQGKPWNQISEVSLGELNQSFSSSEAKEREGGLNRTGTATGELIGGNLSVLYSLCGSPSALKTEGKILFLEDLDEYLYHIDRMMQNLKRNGMLENLNGLIVGGMSDMNDNTIPFGKTAEEIIAETVSGYSFPISFNFPAGHLKDNQALIFGGKVRLEVLEEAAKLSYIE